jgi:apolipoprotein D and lipocalin family protein
MSSRRACRRVAYSLIVGAAVVFLSSCVMSPPNPNPRAHAPLQLAKVDLPRYMGRWYIIANTPYFLEKDLVASNTTYTLREDGKVDEDFSARKGGFDGELKQYRLLDTPDPATGNAHWSVRLFWPIYASQDTLHVDNDYQYTLVGYGNRELGWIFARSPEMSDAKYRELLQRFDELGYDMSRFRRIPQKPEDLVKPGYRTPGSPPS